MTWSARILSTSPSRAATIMGVNSSWRTFCGAARMNCSNKRARSDPPAMFMVHVRLEPTRQVSVAVACPSVLVSVSRMLMCEYDVTLSLRDSKFQSVLRWLALLRRRSVPPRVLVV